MEVHGVYGIPRILWNSGLLHGFPWSPNGTQWNSMGVRQFNGVPLESVKAHGTKNWFSVTPRMELRIELHGTLCNAIETKLILIDSMVTHGIVWVSMEFHGARCNSMELRRIP